MFLEKLNAISRRIDDARALALIDKDGITIESLSTEEGLDLEGLAAELLIQIHSMSNNHRELGGGEVQQLSITSDAGTIVVSCVAQGFYLLLVMGEGGIHGQARFELRRAALELAPDL